MNETSGAGFENLLLLLVFPCSVVSGILWFVGYSLSARTEGVYKFSLLFWLMNLTTSWDMVYQRILTPVMLLFIIHHNLTLEAQRRGDVEAKKTDIFHKIMFVFIPAGFITLYPIFSLSDAYVSATAGALLAFSAMGWIAYFAGWAKVILLGKTKPITAPLAFGFLVAHSISSLMMGYVFYILGR